MYVVVKEKVSIIPSFLSETKKVEDCPERGVETNISPAGASGEFNQNSFAATERDRGRGMLGDNFPDNFVNKWGSN